MNAGALLARLRPRDRGPRALDAPLLAAIVVVLGYALSIASGRYAFAALEALLLALGLFALWLVRLDAPWPSAASAELPSAIALLGLCAAAAELVSQPPPFALYINGPMPFSPFYGAFALAAAFGAMVIVAPSRLVVPAFAAMLVAHAWVCARLIWLSPALDARQGPFLRDWLSILLTDHRLLAVAAQSCCALMLLGIERSRTGAVAATLLLVSPIAVDIVAHDVRAAVLAALLVAAVLSMRKAQRATPWLVGAFVGAAPSLFFVLPLAGLAMRRLARAHRVALALAQALFAAAASFCVAHADTPRWLLAGEVRWPRWLAFSPTSLTLAADWSAWHGGTAPTSTWMPWAPTAFVVVAALARAPRGHVGFAFGAAFALLVFFFCSPSASPGDYFVAFAAACAALASVSRARSTR